MPNDSEVKGLETSAGMDTAGSQQQTILSMLEAGTITPVEATNLLNAIGTRTTEQQPTTTPDNYDATDDMNDSGGVDFTFLGEVAQHSEALQGLKVIHENKQGYAVIQGSKGKLFVFGPSVDNYIGSCIGLDGWWASNTDGQNRLIATLTDVKADGEPYDAPREFTIRGAANNRLHPSLTIFASLSAKVAQEAGLQFDPDVFFKYMSATTYNADTGQIDLNPECVLFTGMIGDTAIKSSDIASLFSIVSIAPTIETDDGIRMGRVKPSTEANIKSAVDALKSMPQSALSLVVWKPTTRRGGKKSRVSAIGEGAIY